MKENVIIGKLIPAGTGLTTYQNLAEEIVPDPVPAPAAMAAAEEEPAPAEL